MNKDLFGLVGMIMMATIALSGCRQKLSNPESVDFIYQDLGSEAKLADAAVSSGEKEIADLKKEIDSYPPRDQRRRHSLDDLRAREQQLVQIRQRAEYLNIRQKQRLEYIARAYEKAFEANAPWPDENEISEYRKIKELRASSRSWDSRVPKSTRYSKKADSGVVVDKKAESGHASEGHHE